jgi:hypothetical protein
VELLRVMKLGRSIVFAEITFSPELRMKAQLDIRIECIFENFFHESAGTSTSSPTTAPSSCKKRSPAWSPIPAFFLLYQTQEA